jgi:hypothetical protein
MKMRTKSHGIKDNLTSVDAGEYALILEGSATATDSTTTGVLVCAAGTCKLRWFLFFW